MVGLVAHSCCEVFPIKWRVDDRPQGRPVHPLLEDPELVHKVVHARWSGDVISEDEELRI